MTDDTRKYALRSPTVHQGTIRASARAFLHALGQDDDDIARPHIGVFHTGGEMSPCNLNLQDQAQHAKMGIYAGGGTPHECPVVSVSKVRILGVSGTKRSRFAPNVPTFEEQGVKGASHSEWFAFLLPPKANADVVARMNAALKTALAAPDVVEGLAGFGLEAMSSSPAELAELLKRDTAKWGPIVKQIGFTAEG